MDEVSAKNQSLEQNITRLEMASERLKAETHRESDAKENELSEIRAQMNRRVRVSYPFPRGVARGHRIEGRIFPIYRESIGGEYDDLLDVSCYRKVERPPSVSPSSYTPDLSQSFLFSSEHSKTKLPKSKIRTARCSSRIAFSKLGVNRLTFGIKRKFKCQY